MARPEWGIAIDGGYFSEVDHVYRDDRGIIVPSSTQVFAILGMSDFSHVKPDILAWKQIYGMAVHRCTELMVFRKLDWNSVDDAIVAPVTGIEMWLTSVEFEPLAVEEVRINKLAGMSHGMRLDLRGTMKYQGKRRHAVIDIKTGSEYGPTWPWQIGSYVAGAPSSGPMGYVGVALQVGKEGKTRPHFVADLHKAKGEFTTLLAAANLKLNAGIA